MQFELMRLSIGKSYEECPLERQKILPGVGLHFSLDSVERWADELDDRTWEPREDRHEHQDGPEQDHDPCRESKEPEDTVPHLGRMRFSVRR